MLLRPATDDTSVELIHFGSHEFGEEIALECLSTDAPCKFELDLNALDPGDRLTFWLHSKEEPSVRAEDRNGLLAQIDISQHPIVNSLHECSCLISSAARELLVAAPQGQRVGLVTGSTAPGSVRGPYREMGPYRYKPWVAVGALLVLFLALLDWSLYVDFLDAAQRRFAVVFAAALGAISIFNLKIPATILSRYPALLVSKARAKCAIAFSVLASLVLAYAAIGPLHCIWRAYLYDRHISTSLLAVETPKRIDAATEAMRIFPARPESYAVISKALDDLRYSDRRLLRKFAQDFVSAENGIRERILKFLNGDELCDCTAYAPSFIEAQRRRVLSWFMFREAEAHELGGDVAQKSLWIEAQLSEKILNDPYYKLRHATWLLSNIDHTAALEVGIAVASNELIDPVLLAKKREIDAEFERVRSYVFGDLDDESGTGLGLISDFPNDYVVQLGLDKLFQHHLFSCDFEKAAIHFSQLLLLRQKSRDTGVLWLDGPEKLGALIFVRSIRASDAVFSSTLYLPASFMRDHYVRCPNWGASKPDFLNLLKNDYPDWWKADEGEWRKGTIEGLPWGAVAPLIQMMKSEAWRY
jgi:hypothetical protein